METIKNCIFKNRNGFAAKRINEISYFSTNKSDIENFSRCLLSTIMNVKGIKKKKGIIIVCIGTDRSTGDCLGPLLGYKLKEIENNRIKVFGTLKHPVHALNLDYYLEEIKNEFRNWIIIAVDASVGTADHVGLVTISQGSLAPGAGVGKDISRVGDVSITGIVTSSSSPENLMGIRLSIIMDMVEFLYASMEHLKHIFK
jgi:putative sporulation protein YyaC